MRLKQLSLDELEADESDVVAAFSSYFSDWERDRASVEVAGRSELAELLGADHGYDVRTEALRNRRFAGDGNLARRRYFSLCDDDGGDDGTMLREVTAYCNPAQFGPIELNESVGAGVNGTIDVALSRYAFEAGGPGGPPRFRRAAYQIPIRVTEERFLRMIDLRDPETATWFTRNLTRSRWNTETGEQPAFPMKEPIDRFEQLLPSLMTQANGGGGGAPRIAGAWLRALGADALVYPSARSDVTVAVDSGRVVDSRGWCLVDYRHVGAPRAITLDLTRAWSRSVLRNGDEGDGGQEPLFRRTSLLWAEAANRLRWSWSGIEDANLAVRQFIGALHAFKWAAGAGRDRISALSSWLTGADDDPVETRVRSTALVLALEGVAEARRAVVAAGANTVGDEVMALIDLPGTFRRMDQIL